MRIGKKTIHSVIIGLAMALPILYLGGSMIAGLCGAHGEQLWADPVYVEQYVEVDNYVNNGKQYKIEVTGPVGNISNFPNDFKVSNMNYLYNGNSYTRFTYGTYTNFKFLNFGGSDVWHYFPDTGVEQNVSPSPWVIYASDVTDEFLSLLNGYLAFYVLETVPSDVVPENNSSYSVFLFENFFPKNNFVSRIGENALSENPKGFAPFGTMLSYLDSNMFHAGDSQTGLMVYGMVYWSLHVIIADLVYHVLVFVPNLINKVFDWFGQRGLNDE